MTEEPNPVNDLTLDDAVVRHTADEVRQSARRAHRTEVALVVVASVLMVAVAAFTGFNTYRLREVNRNLTQLVESLEANQEAQQKYNEAHAGNAGMNFEALVENIKCFTNFFVSFNQAVAAGGAAPDKAFLDACFLPAYPAPPPEELPSQNNRPKDTATTTREG